MGEEDRPEFFKIVQSCLNTAQHLQIPPDFVKHIPKESGMVVLKHSGGGQWRVKLCKTEDGSFLEDGWQNFVRDNTLGEYELVVFRYDGNMCFSVKIFDANACKRRYECITEKPQQSEVKKRKRSRMALIGFSSRKRKRRTESAVSASKQENLFKASVSFTSKHPYCIQQLGEACVSTGFVLHMPASFTKAHLPNEKAKVSVEDQNGKSWTLNYLPGPRHGRGRFCGGVVGFVRDNQLKKGDICIFELVGELKLSVHIYRISESD